jgi:hypothetical protein
VSQALQLAGAIAILLPFAWVQLGSLSPVSVPYLALNLAGSALLGAVALSGHQWGFLLLETTWALVSAWSLARRR